MKRGVREEIKMRIGRTGVEGKKGVQEQRGRKRVIMR